MESCGMQVSRWDVLAYPSSWELFLGSGVCPDFDLVLSYTQKCGQKELI
jgi:hypothetical protein